MKSLQEWGEPADNPVHEMKEFVNGGFVELGPDMRVRRIVERIGAQLHDMLSGPPTVIENDEQEDGEPAE